MSSGPNRRMILQPSLQQASPLAEVSRAFVHTACRVSCSNLVPEGHSLVLQKTTHYPEMEELHYTPFLSWPHVTGKALENISAEKSPCVASVHSHEAGDDEASALSDASVKGYRTLTNGRKNTAELLFLLLWINQKGHNNGLLLPSTVCF